MITYNPDVIRSAASRLYLRAALTVVVSGILGCLIGLVGGPYLNQNLPPALSTRVPDWSFIVLLGILGLAQGWERAIQMRLQAQAALCQLQIEENTRGGRGDQKTELQTSEPQGAGSRA